MLKFITRENVLDLIQANGNLFFAVTFVKKDGTKRNMQCRIGSQRGLVETPTAAGAQAVETRKARHPNLISVRDVHAARAGKPAWRSVNLDTVETVRLGGDLYLVD